MLNSEYIHSKIIAPATCSSEDTSKLHELSTLFPYASSFSVLYLKALSNSGDIRLESELEKVAFKISDRGILYNLLHPKNEVFSENSSLESNSKEAQLSTETTTININSVAEEEKLDSDCQAMEKVFKETKDVEEELITEVDIEDVACAGNVELDNCEAPEEKSTDLVTDLPNAFEATMQDELDKIIVSAAISNAYVEQELIHSSPELTNSDVEKENAEVIEIKEVSMEPIHEEVIPNVEKIREEIVKNVAPKSFTAWLKVTQSKNEVSDELVDNSKKTEYYTFEKPKKEFFSPVKKAKESLDENKMPVSETLAKIFALQGNYSKAIYVYEQLTLLFPEKKSFFASQIRNLKKKINS